MKNVKVTTSDNLELTGKLFENPTLKEAIIVHIPGMAGDIYSTGYYSIMKKLYPQVGISFLATESRASLDPVTKGKDFSSDLFEDSIIDVDAWFKFAMNLGYKKIWLQAGSLGPSKIVNWYFYRKPIDIAGLIFLSPSDMIGMVNDELGYKDHKLMLPMAQNLVSQGRGDQEIDHLLWGVKRLTANAYISLFGPDSEAAVFNYGDSSLGWEKVNSIDKPVLSFTGTNDDGILPVMDVYEAMRILDSQLSKCPRKKLIVYEGADHDFNGFEKEVVKTAIDFIASIN